MVVDSNVEGASVPEREDVPNDVESKCCEDTKPGEQCCRDKKCCDGEKCCATESCCSGGEGCGDRTCPCGRVKLKKAVAVGVLGLLVVAVIIAKKKHHGCHE